MIEFYINNKEYYYHTKIPFPFNMRIGEVIFLDEFLPILTRGSINNVVKGKSGDNKFVKCNSCFIITGITYSREDSINIYKTYNIEPQ